MEYLLKDAGMQCHIFGQFMALSDVHYFRLRYLSGAFILSFQIYTDVFGTPGTHEIFGPEAQTEAAPQFDRKTLAIFREHGVGSTSGTL